MDEETGEVVVQYHATDIVRVNVSGDVKITSGGYHTARGTNLSGFDAENYQGSVH